MRRSLLPRLRHPFGLFPAAVGLCAAQPALAQQQDEQLWLQLNTNVKLTKKARITLEQIARFGDRPGGLFQTEFGAVLGYRVADNVELGFGYRRVGFHNRNTADDEDRIRQQIVATFGRVFTRIRVDERFHTQQSGVGIRIRPLLRYNLPIGERKGFGLFASHESFFLPNSTHWGQRSGYERMRNIIGVTVPLGRAISADMGYLNQYRLARGGSSAQMDHALTIQLTLNFSDLVAPHADD